VSYNLHLNKTVALSYATPFVLRVRVKREETSRRHRNLLQDNSQTWRATEVLDYNIKKYSEACDITSFASFSLLLCHRCIVQRDEWKEDRSHQDFSAEHCTPARSSFVHNSVMFFISRGLTELLVMSAAWQRRQFADYQLHSNEQSDVNVINMKVWLNS